MSFRRNSVIVLGFLLVFTIGIHNDIDRWKNKDDVRKDSNIHIRANEFMNQLNSQNVIDSENLSWLTGYVRTYREYYNEFTRHILDLLMKKMNEFRDATFVWTEICFLQEWWEEQTAATRELLKQLVKEGRLEISPGGWVVADEASVPYTAYLDQLSEGRNWVKRNIGTLSDISFGLDQFTLSPGAAYMQHHYGIRNAVLKRLHHGIKAFMMTNRLMNFWWRQEWDKSDSCGPDRNVCSDLDLTNHARLPDLNTPEINKTIHLRYHKYNNLDDFATKLVKALHQKSEGYQHKQILLPLGDDFRYNTEADWNQQYRNTQILMRYINSQSKFKTNITFGTLQKFFDDMKTNKANTNLHYPIITGDFMPLKVKSSPFYWSGSFTTRPFLKRLGREVQESVTATDCFLALSLMKFSRNKIDINRLKYLTKNVSDCRHEVNLFQHHDAVTGTSRARVILDYETRLLKTFVQSQDLLASILLQFITETNQHAVTRNVFFVPLAHRHQHNHLIDGFNINFPDTNDTEVSLMFVNSYHRTRKHGTNMEIDVQRNKRLMVLDNHGRKVDFQEKIVTENKRRISFDVDIPALGWVIFKVVNNLKVSNQIPIKKNKQDLREHVLDETANVCENNFIKVSFPASSGSTILLCNKVDDVCVNLKVAFSHYDAPGSCFTTGMNGRLISLETDFISETKQCVFRLQNKQETIAMVATFANTSGQFGSLLQIDVISHLFNYNKAFVGELIIAIQTELNSTLYTDINGLWPSKREHRQQLQFGASVYPMTSFALLQDNERRLNVFTNAARGVTSQKPGNLAVVIDRAGPIRMSGLNEPVNDKKLSKTSLFLALEKQPTNNGEYNSLSRISILQNGLVQHPVYAFSIKDATRHIPPYYSFARKGIDILPEDVEIANFKVLVNDESAMESQSRISLSLTLYRHACYDTYEKYVNIDLRQLFSVDETLDTFSCKMESGVLVGLDMLNECRVSLKQFELLTVIITVSRNN
ncbi:MA2A1-like protein [Mya arenaria]|uniref:MA2A1-like protein n=1 Tax=Mya arenaria TaxID=6604 RepID=A0ABY7EYD5_MYAAR|nr:MA2A1-like protein [Mya arenaria]